MNGHHKKKKKQQSATTNAATSALSAQPTPSDSETTSSAQQADAAGAAAASIQALRVNESTAAAAPVAAVAVVDSAVAAPSAAVSSSAAAAGDSASCSGAASAGLKKCAVCQRSLPESDYSGAQLKAKGKRHCKQCVGVSQVFRELSPCQVLGSKRVLAGLTALRPQLDSALPSEQLIGLDRLFHLLTEYDGWVLSLFLHAVHMSRVLSLLVGAQPNQPLFQCAIACVGNISRHRLLVPALVEAGAIPSMLVLLRRPHTGAVVHSRAVESCVDILGCIAEHSNDHCERMRELGVLDALIPFVKASASSRMREALVSVFNSTLSECEPGQAEALVSHLGAQVVDPSTPSKFLVFCLIMLNDAFEGSDEEFKEDWIGAILAAHDDFPSRLVALLGHQQPVVHVAALSLLADLFDHGSDELCQLEELGLLDRLLPLLRDGKVGAKSSQSASDDTRALAVDVCTGAAMWTGEDVVDDERVIKCLLHLLATASGDTLYAVARFFASVVEMHDIDTVQRLVHHYRLMPVLVATLRKTCASGDKDGDVSSALLDTIVDVLRTGDAESEADARRWCGVNPYNEPLFDLGVFEIAESLCDSKDAELAAVAKAIFAYCTPDDVD